MENKKIMVTFGIVIAALIATIAIGSIALQRHYNHVILQELIDGANERGLEYRVVLDTDLRGNFSFEIIDEQEK
ncbi:hypothetical protein [Corynebacterium sp. sy039]|uniref:hypothetical protein n=1 Tax=Corynebacterium sp. sy039 TaxID=2599641 RepID=UPI0011B78D1B|nr:hypothetical protein [Corynebacterium sp. sy039]QDZ41742.1 hypothetical protein FQV43_00100 [Corynebacterium sp. sy039]